MSTGTKAALGAAIALGVILVGTGVYLFLKRRRNTTNPPVAVGAEPSTDPEKYDGQSNRFFYARKASTEQQVVTATITNGYELDGCSAEQPPIEHMMPHEVGGNPVYHSQGNPLHESGGQGRCETSGNPRYEIHGHPRDNYEAVSYNYEVT
jgi:LPXTG-motif cell wall-anchored protein